jgi:hypothetical protein
MFDFEPAIAKWRSQMLAGGIKAPVPLDELESHLREEIDRQALAGEDGMRAIEIAVQKIGGVRTLKSEFTKNKTTLMKRTIVILAALFGMAIGLGLILPALAKWVREGVQQFSLLLVGLAMVIIAGGIIISGVRGQRKASERKLITGFMIAAAIFFSIPLIQSFFERNVGVIDWVVCAGLAGASVLFYGICIRLLWRNSSAPLCNG